jgi:hypothetical protein
MESLLNERAKIYDIIQNIKMRNSEENVSKAMKILKQLLTNIKNNPEDLKFRMIKTTNPNISNSLMNINGIYDLLYNIGYIAENDGNYMLETTNLNNVELCLSILSSDITQFSQKEYVKETSQLMMKNPQVFKEMEAKKKKLEEEKRQKERINEMIEADKVERKMKFTYK